MDREGISIQECIEKYEKEHETAVIVAGQVTGFIPQED